MTKENIIDVRQTMCIHWKIQKTRLVIQTQLIVWTSYTPNYKQSKTLNLKKQLPHLFRSMGKYDYT